PQAEARHEPRRSSDTSPVDADIRPKRRAKWFSCGPLDFLDSRSIFFIATHPVWFTWQCSVVVNQFQVPGIFRPETGVSGRISSAVPDAPPGWWAGSLERSRPSPVVSGQLPL